MLIFARMLTFLSFTFLFSSVGIAQDTEISDGKAIQLSDTEIWITPPKGWELLKNHLGKAVVIQESKPKKEIYGKATYQRNLTVAVAHTPMPTDDVTVSQLRTKLVDSFSKYGKDFTLADKVEYFDFNSKNDGVLIYSFLKLGGEEMTQAHVFVSGREKSLLMTYTDFSKRFEEDQEVFSQIWKTMTTAHLKGQSPNRYEEYILPAAVSGALFLLLIVFIIVRKIRAKKAFNSDDDFFDSSETLEKETPSSDGEFTSISDISVTSW